MFLFKKEEEEEIPPTPHYNEIYLKNDIYWLYKLNVVMKVPPYCGIC
jgi:hypothetical protein